MAVYQLKADLRENLNKSHTKSLRKEGLVPGVYYFHGVEPKAIAVNKKEMLIAIKKNAHIFELNTGKEKMQTIIKTIQWHPITDEPIHVDFLGVSEKEAVEVSVKVETKGLAAGVKEQGGLLSQTVWHLNVKCLIQDIPEKIIIDVTKLKLGKSIAVKDLDIEKVEFVESPEKSIVSVVAPKGSSISASDDEEEDEE